MEKGRGFLLTTWSGRVVVVLIGILGALGLLGLGFLLSNTVGAAQVAANARALHVTNATLGASGIARAGVAQAVFFSVESFSEGDVGMAPEASGDPRNIEPREGLMVAFNTSVEAIRTHWMSALALGRSPPSCC